MHWNRYALAVEVIRVLMTRKGFDQWWEPCPRETREEIQDAIAFRLDALLWEAWHAPEGPRCPHCDSPLLDPVTAGELKELRRAADLSQRELAARLDLHHTYVNKLENGKVPIPPDMRRRYRKALT